MSDKVKELNPEDLKLNREIAKQLREIADLLEVGKTGNMVCFVERDDGVQTVAGVFGPMPQILNSMELLKLRVHLDYLQRMQTQQPQGAH